METSDTAKTELAALLVGIDSLLEGHRAGILPRSFFARLLTPDNQRILTEIGLLTLHSKSFDKEALTVLLEDEASRLGVQPSDETLSLKTNKSGGKSKKESNINSLRKARERRHLTQTQVALLMGCSQSLVWKWECGLTTPAPRFQEKLNRILDLNSQRGE